MHNKSVPARVRGGVTSFHWFLGLEDPQKPKNKRTKYFFPALSISGYFVITECPTDMLTTSDSILQFLKPHIPKSKTCFEILVKRAYLMRIDNL